MDYKQQNLTAPQASYVQTAQPFRPAGQHGLTASPFFAPQIRADLQTLYDTLAALRAVADAANFVDETREFLIDCIETGLTGEVPNSGQEPTEFTVAALRLYNVQAEGRMDAQWGQRLIQATRRDTSRPTCASWSDLMLYCRYEAEPLGRAVLELHGISDAEVERATDAITAALLVLRLLCRMGDDWKLYGRCYLPTDWIAENGGSPEQLVEKHSSPALTATKERVLERVAHLLTLAQPLPQLIENPRLKAEAWRLLASAKYQYRQLHSRDPLAHKISIPMWRKALIHARAWWLAKR